MKTLFEKMRANRVRADAAKAKLDDYRRRQIVNRVMQQPGSRARRERILGVFDA